MIYQKSLKEEVAAYNKVDPTTYYELPFEEWSKIRDEHERVTHSDKKE